LPTGFNHPKEKQVMSKDYDEDQVNELLRQAIETEIGGIEIYTEALECVSNKDLRQEWEEYLEQTRQHKEILEDLFNDLGLDASQGSPGREVVSLLGKSLVKAMNKARDFGDSRDAELVAAECVVLAETKDHLNWGLLGEVAKHCGGKLGRLIQDAYDEVEVEEDHHLYHTKGFCRELWLKSLGLPAVIPPPEELKDVESAIGAARAEKARVEMLGKAQ
jgi:ferritin-like metal-binding protein YciE